MDRIAQQRFKEGGRTTSFGQPTDSTGEAELNQFNINMRSQPWYVEWHRQRGLNPSGNGNRKLSGEEQDELEALVSANMFNGKPVGKGGMTIDSGGSLNQKGGWSGLPTWAKVAVIAGATAATAGAAGAFTGATGSTALGGTTAAKGAGMAAGATASGAVPAVASTAVPAAVGTGVSTAMKYAPYAGAGLNFLGNYLEGRSQDKRADEDRAFTSEENQKTRNSTQQQLMAEFLGSNLKSDTDEQLQRSNMALSATQMDPFAHAKARNSANIKRSFGTGVDPAGYFKGSYDLSALEPGNLDKVGGQFQSVMNEARNGPAGWEDKKAKEREAILAYLRNYANGGA